MAKKQEELQNLGFLGIIKKSLNIIFSQPKIFTQITLFFIFPISCIGLATNIGLSNYVDHVNLFFPNTVYSTSTSVGLPPSYRDIPNANLSSSSSKAGFYGLFLFSYMVLSFVFSLFSVSTTVYTAVCTTTDKEISFRKAISIVPRVWKQVTLTYLSRLGINLVFFLIYFVITFLIIIGYLLVVSSDIYSPKSILVTSIGFMLFIGVILYTTIIWLLSDVISVLEKISGIKALKKSKALIKGKMGIAFSTYLGLLVCTLPSVVLLMKLKNNEGKGWERICYGIIYLILSSLFSIFTLVVKSVVYLVCKSHHHETIDNLSLIGYIELNSEEEHFP